MSIQTQYYHLCKTEIYFHEHIFISLCKYLCRKYAHSVLYAPICLLVPNFRSCSIVAHIIIFHLSTFRDTMCQRVSAVCVPSQNSCWCLQSSADLQSQNIYSLNTSYDHVFGCGGRDKTTRCHVCTRLTRIRSICIRVRRCSDISLPDSPTSTNVLCYTILLVNIKSYCGCLLFFSPVLLMVVCYLPLPGFISYMSQHNNSFQWHLCPLKVQDLYLEVIFILNVVTSTHIVTAAE